MLEMATATITFDEVLEALFPPEGLLRLVGEDGRDQSFRRVTPSSWVALGDVRSAALSECIAARGMMNARFSPVAWRTLGTPSPIAAVACVWAGIGYQLAAAEQPDVPGPRMLPGVIDRARARLTGAGWFPSVLINEGDRLSAFWALERPLTNLTHFQWLLDRLATRLNGERALADPAAALVRVPGSGLAVTVERCDIERRYTVAEIERMVERASAERSGRKGARMEMKEAGRESFESFQPGSAALV